MYWVVDGCCFCSGLVLFALLISYDYAWLCWTGILWICLYPLLLENILNLTAAFAPKHQYPPQARSRFVYNPHYNITFCGIEKCHPFDSQKYGNIHNILIQRGLLSEGEAIEPQKVPRELLLERMSRCYLLKMCYTLSICKYIEMPLFFLPAFLLRWRVLDPMLTATEGSLLAVCAAMRLGWAVNLSGGFHHASFEQGGGFCVYPDISLAVHYLRSRLGVRRVMVVDLDAHQGNGHERDHLGDEDVFTFDAYNHHIYPNDRQAARAIRRDIAVQPSTTTEQYLLRLDALREDIEAFRPQFVIYNAGTDILEGDPLGRLRISAEGIVLRDQRVIRMCVDRKIPVAMLLSGGYQMVNAEIIANSIQNLLQKLG